MDEKTKEKLIESCIDNQFNINKALKDSNVLMSDLFNALLTDSVFAEKFRMVIQISRSILLLSAINEVVGGSPKITEIVRVINSIPESPVSKNYSGDTHSEFETKIKAILPIDDSGNEARFVGI